jgi:Transcriptional regulator SbtR-like, C-terminal domain
LLLHEQAPIDALRSWVERLTRYAVTKHGLADALRKATSPRSELSADTYAAIVAALDRLLQANIRAGTPRPDLDAEDVILALAGLWQLDPASDWRSQAQRVYDIVLVGYSDPADVLAATSSDAQSSGSAAFLLRRDRAVRSIAPRLRGTQVKAAPALPWRAGATVAAELVRAADEPQSSAPAPSSRLLSAEKQGCPL